WDGKLFAVHDPWCLSDDIQYATRQVAYRTYPVLAALFAAGAATFPIQPAPCLHPIPFNFVHHRSP
ncbi:MAG: hypothetical protein ABIR69_05215, partial [Nitrospiraceae bacterium]